MLYRKNVIGLVTRSIAEFSLLVGRNTTTQVLLPDIWVDGKSLIQYQSLDDESYIYRERVTR